MEPFTPYYSGNDSHPGRPVYYFRMMNGVKAPQAMYPYEGRLEPASGSLAPDAGYANAQQTVRRSICAQKQ
ncbi:Uu.00g051390.m01.CDS01 [Anthostomella pinea]|uniref:Uu.00g051390.m01.CDS01 n=1 Tax=Anthostomella pinea TaxID=933095 RepID=A0AAI8VSS7_9PEZI|nr:Uu.00g051390.m01.CDS01 [Anthostomella pinea]